MINIDKCPNCKSEWLQKDNEKYCSYCPNIILYEYGGGLPFQLEVNNNTNYNKSSRHIIRFDFIRNITKICYFEQSSYREFPVMKVIELNFLLPFDVTKLTLDKIKTYSTFA